MHGQDTMVKHGQDTKVKDGQNINDKYGKDTKDKHGQWAMQETMVKHGQDTTLSMARLLRLSMASGAPRRYYGCHSDGTTVILYEFPLSLSNFSFYELESLCL